MNAMGCQYKLDGRIAEVRAEYLFALKENQGALYEDVKTY
jgi:predicted transposase YbfD/YdcC